VTKLASFLLIINSGYTWCCGMIVRASYLRLPGDMLGSQPLHFHFQVSLQVIHTYVPFVIKQYNFVLIRGVGRCQIGRQTDCVVHSITFFN